MNPEYKKFLTEVCNIYGHDELMINILAQDDFWMYCFNEFMSPQEAADEFDDMMERELDKWSK